MHARDHEISADEVMDRRGLFKRLAVLSGGTAVACAMLSAKSLAAQLTAENDPGVLTETLEYPGETGAVVAYMARPKVEGKVPAVLVIHEIWGLNQHIKDVTRRIALEGFLALAPDAMSPLGGTPDSVDKARQLMGQLDYTATVKNFVAAVKYLQTHPLSTGKVGCTGFCWGGAMTNQVAVNSPDVSAAVPYYGSQPAAEDVTKIKAALMLHYAGDDERINAGIPAFEEALKKAGVEYQLFMYQGAKHAFNNDSNPGRYNKEAAELAWKRTIAFFKEKLG